MREDAELIPILLNPSAGGRAIAARERLEAVLRNRGIRVSLRQVTADRMAATVRALRDADVPIIGVAGGDGTLRAAAEVLAGGQTALAVLPTGTLNNFARRLGITDLESAADALAHAHVLRVPLGVVDDRVFLNTATFGQYAAVVRRREHLRRWIGKWPAAGVAFARAVRVLQPVSIAIDVPAGRLERATPLVWVGLGRSSFPRARRSDAPINAEFLEVVVADVPTRRSAFAFLTRLFLRMLGDRPSTQDAAIEVLHTTHLLLRGPARIEATFDGEVFRLAAPVAVSFQPGALRVIAPYG